MTFQLKETIPLRTYNILGLLLFQTAILATCNYAKFQLANSFISHSYTSLEWLFETIIILRNAIRPPTEVRRGMVSLNLPDYNMYNF